MVQVNLLSLLNGDNFGVFNRELAHQIGLHEAIIFYELVAKHQFLEKSHIEIDGTDGYFFCTTDNLLERTTLKRKPQTAAIKNLIKLGLIEQRNYGLPMKRYFRINVEKIFEITSVKKKIAKMSKRDNLGCPKGTTYNVQKGQTHHIYENNVREKENIQKKGNDVVDEPLDSPSAQTDSAAPHTSLSFFSFKRVKMKQREYERLVNEFGKERIDDLVEQLDEYADIDPKKFKKYANHATVVRSWIRRSSLKASKTPQNRIKEIQEYIQSHPKKELLKKALKAKLIEIGRDYIDFMRKGGESYIKFTERNAEVLIDHWILKSEEVWKKI